MITMLEYKRERLMSYERMAVTHLDRAVRFAEDSHPSSQAQAECHMAISLRCGRDVEKLKAQIERLEAAEPFFVAL